MRLLIASNLYLSTSKPANRTDLDYFSNALDSLSIFLDEARLHNAAPVLAGAFIGKLQAAEAVQFTAKLMRAHVAPIVINAMPCSVLCALSHAKLIKLVDQSPLLIDEWLIGHSSMSMAISDNELMFKDKPKKVCFVNEPVTSSDADGIFYSPHIALKSQLQINQLKDSLFLTLPHSTRFHGENDNAPMFTLVEKFGANIVGKKIECNYDHDEYIKQIDPSRKGFVNQDELSGGVSEFASKLSQLSKLNKTDSAISKGQSDNSFNQLIEQIGHDMLLSDNTIRSTMSLFE